MFMRSIHPGEVLRDELDVLGVSPTELARRVKVPDNRLVLRSEIKSINSHNHRCVTVWIFYNGETT